MTEVELDLVIDDIEYRQRLALNLGNVEIVVMGCGAQSKRRQT